MHFWTAIVLIVLIMTIGEILRTRIKENAKHAKLPPDNLASRVSRLEDRIENIETILLDKEKTGKFDQLLED